jgi:hypothetical protein
MSFYIYITLLAVALIIFGRECYKVGYRDATEKAERKENEGV